MLALTCLLVHVLCEVYQYHEKVLKDEHLLNNLCRLRAELLLKGVRTHHKYEHPLDGSQYPLLVQVKNTLKCQFFEIAKRVSFSIAKSKTVENLMARNILRASSLNLSLALPTARITLSFKS